MKLVLFNGPPRCGKDTAAQAIFFSQAVPDPKIFERMAMPIKRAFACTVGTICDQWGNVWPYEREKDSPIPFLGVSYRRWQIDFSERFLKHYGEDIFGKLLVRRLFEKGLKNGGGENALVLVADCGFQIEREALAEFNPVLVRIEREGTSFLGDSRSYLPDPDYIVQNNSDQKTFEDEMVRLALQIKYGR